MTVLELLEDLRAVAQEGRGNAQVIVFTEYDDEIEEVDGIDTHDFRGVTNKPYIKLIVQTGN